VTFHPYKILKNFYPESKLDETFIFLIFDQKFLELEKARPSIDQILFYRDRHIHYMSLDFGLKMNKKNLDFGRMVKRVEKLQLAPQSLRCDER
jgi:hypothetical protein